MKGQPTKWSKKQIAFLQDNFPFMMNKEIADYLGLSTRTVIRKARELNLQKYEMFRYSIRKKFHEWGCKGSESLASIETRFKKGVHASPETEFKKGQKSFNSLPLFQRLQIIDNNNQFNY